MRILSCLPLLVLLPVLGCSSSDPAGPGPSVLADAGADSASDGSPGHDASSEAASSDAASSDAASDTPPDGASTDAGAEAGKEDGMEPFPPVCEATCSSSEVCVGEACCSPPTASGSFSLPAHTSYVRWTFGTKGVSQLEFDVHILQDPGEEVGLYFSPFNGSIDDTQFYFGIQTNVRKPDVGWTGKGLIFSHWGSFDAADTRVPADGFIELGTHEGMFIGVRRNFAWTVGEYTVKLARAEQAGDGDWFDLSITDVAKGETTGIGGLRVKRADAAVPAVIRPTGTGFTEVYSGATDYADVPQWHLRVMGYGDGQRATKAKSEYPAYPTAEYPNTDVYYRAASDLIYLTYGGMTPRCHAAGLLF